MDVRSVGVEEELLLVEPGSGRPRAVAAAVLRAGDAGGGPGDAAAELEYELQLQQVETSTQPCVSLDELAGELRGPAPGARRPPGGWASRWRPWATSPVAVEPETARRSPATSAWPRPSG